LGVEVKHGGGNLEVWSDGIGDTEGRLETSSRQEAPETEKPMLLAEETLKTSQGGERASEGLRGEREERRVLGKLGPRRGVRAWRRKTRRGERPSQG